jgi:hypothetical protein
MKSRVQSPIANAQTAHEMKTNKTVIQHVKRPWIWCKAKHAAELTIIAALALMAVGPSIRGGEPARSKALTAEDVIKRWSPRLKNHTDYGHLGGSPEHSPNVAAYSFRVVGPTFEELWNHYAERCGIKQRYAEKTFLNTANTNANGSYVVSERPSRDRKGGRGPSVFLLKTDAYTVTVTFQLDADRKSISGSLTAAIP